MSLKVRNKAPKPHPLRSLTGFWGHFCTLLHAGTSWLSADTYSVAGHQAGRARRAYSSECVCVSVLFQAGNVICSRGPKRRTPQAKGLVTPFLWFTTFLFQHLCWAFLTLQVWLEESLKCGFWAETHCTMSYAIFIWQQRWDFANRPLVSPWRLETCCWSIWVRLKGFSAAGEKLTCWALIKGLLVVWLTVFLLMHQTSIVS